MASFEPIIRMNENAIRAPKNMQPKAHRKPLGDVTNSNKPQYKDKPSAKDVSGFKAVEKMQPKKGRKPLGDLTNSCKPRVAEKPSKNCSEVQLLSGVAGEKFLHNHQDCIKAQRQPMMSMDYFLETAGLQKEVSAPVSTPWRPVKSTASKSKLETPMKFALDEFETDMFCGGTPALKSPMWNIDMKDSEFSGFKLKGDFSGFKLKGSP